MAHSTNLKWVIIRDQPMQQFVERTRLLLRLLSMTFVLTVIGTGLALAHAERLPSATKFVNALAAEPIPELKIFAHITYMAADLSRTEALSHFSPTAEYVNAGNDDPYSVNSTDQISFFFTRGPTISSSTCSGNCCACSSGCCKSSSCGADCAACAGAALLPARSDAYQGSLDNWRAIPPNDHFTLWLAPQLPPPRV